MRQPYGRKVRDHQEAADLLPKWEASGERMSDWCRSRGINWYSLNAYRGRAANAFVELAIGPVVTETVSAPRYRICLGDDIGIEVDDHFQEETLRRLIGVVETC